VHAYRSLVLLAAPLAAAATLSACDRGSTPQGAPAQQPTGASSPPTAETVRACRTAVYGDPVRRNAVTVGPISVLVADRHADFQPSREVKALVLIRAGERVTLVVPEDERNRLSLLYDSGPGPNHPLRLSDGTSSVRFSACTSSEEWAEGQPYPDPHETQFNGGFFVRGAQCATLEVWVDGRPEPSRLELAFGMGGRPCPGESDDA
jgi:hypothetical protein